MFLIHLASCADRKTDGRGSSFVGLVEWRHGMAWKAGRGIAYLAYVLVSDKDSKQNNRNDSE